MDPAIPDTQWAQVAEKTGGRKLVMTFREPAKKVQAEATRSRRIQTDSSCKTRFR